jgi:xanthine dehydrogenase YagT iron-sulfur-binding subunit
MMKDRDEAPAGDMSENSGNSALGAVSRRGALQGGAALVAISLAADAASVAQSKAALAVPDAQALTVNTTINGKAMALKIDPRSSLLDVLRERLALTGAKKGCDHGQCGACTVHIDGRRVASCLTLAAKVEGRSVLTIEGLSSGEVLHPMQQAFIDHDALQCGYCTPGQIMAAVACVAEGNATSKDRIREYMSGNICRCGAYVRRCQRFCKCGRGCAVYRGRHFAL